MKISTHLSLDEVIKSATATRLGIDNTPTEEHTENLKAFAGAIFEPLRVHFGKPIHVSSGYRCPALNAAVPGSARKSQHQEGEALDLDQQGKNTGVTNREVFLWLRDNTPFDQLIWEFGTEVEPNWVHVSYTRHRPRRGEVMRASKVASGASLYTKWWGPKSGTGRLPPATLLKP